jgi:hypothetical protein
MTPLEVGEMPWQMARAVCYGRRHGREVQARGDCDTILSFPPLRGAARAAQQWPPRRGGSGPVPKGEDRPAAQRRLPLAGLLPSVGRHRRGHLLYVHEPEQRVAEPAPVDRLLVLPCPGRKPAVLVFKRPARPYKSPIQNGFS